MLRFFRQSLRQKDVKGKEPREMLGKGGMPGRKEGVTGNLYFFKENAVNIMLWITLWIMCKTLRLQQFLRFQKCYERNYDEYFLCKGAFREK